MSWIPCAGDTGIKGTIASCAPAGNFLILIWQDQSRPNSIYSGPSDVKNPLLLEMYPGWVIVSIDSVARGAVVPVGTLVAVDIVQAPYGITAVNARAL
jgi:hypothetical protein